MRRTLALALLVAAGGPFLGSASAAYCTTVDVFVPGAPAVAPVAQCVDNPGVPEQRACYAVSSPRSGYVEVCTTLPV